MFLVIPAVDVKQGNAVRLLGGDPKHTTVYFADPAEAAAGFVARGASYLHLVDLDAALGSGDNRETIVRTAEASGVRCEVGGGIRSEAAAAWWLERLDRVVISTLAVTQPEVVERLIGEYGSERVAVSVDAKRGLVAVRGWTELSEVRAVDLAERLAGIGVTKLIYTDVARDGTLLGVDEAPVAAMREAFPGDLIAGGGVASDADLDLYESLGLQGAIVGKALYEGKITYPRAA